jgi:hypothetical protein
VLRGIVHDHIKPRRNQLVADARKREIQAEKSAQQRRYRAARRNSISQAIELFSPELDRRYTKRAVDRVDQDGTALVKLGLQVARLLAARTQVKDPHDPGARQPTRQFADEFVRILGFALAKPSEMISLSKLDAMPSR